MIRKIVLQLFVSLILILFLTSSFVLTVVYINKSRPEKKDKLYEVNSAPDSFVQTVAYYLVKPIIESALDRYIEKHGLAEYLQTQQEAEQINFYEITEGQGSKAFCGQEVVLQIYKISNKGLATPFAFSNQVSDTIMKIGQGDLLSLGIIGMKEGGERVVTITNNDFKTYYVKLIEVKDPYLSSVDNLMIFNDLTNKSGKQITCGDEVSVKYSVREHNGEYTSKNHTVKFRVGDKKVPLAMELGVVGMKVGNNRTIISPPELLRVTDDTLMEDIGFDEENISIIDLVIEE
ncbi:FKBP-type peptidyl-prolyl cis-trans isomerase [Wolbachia endosymbiont of Ctenocephalides felis wCfeT]|uniref:FKBP-type peptidyl-prolyl cis-trans isomerase n=1 Tax=Wolbachia endosymbiont of Ctenocephalides felis wCfeT TaxID=2732593 RepID=UPI0014460BBC|nr:FKBP-type peptidyl-prolyl cis-trans isomerase [Wolbachia endosymbiont of Ctenocephalides felis wCfeT]